MSQVVEADVEESGFVAGAGPDAFRAEPRVIGHAEHAVCWTRAASAQRRQRVVQARRDADHPLAHSLGVERADGDEAAVEIDVGPEELEQLTLSAAGVESGDDERVDVPPRRLCARSQQAFFLCSGEDALAFTLARER
jgi:hypothetical protein